MLDAVAVAVVVAVALARQAGRLLEHPGSCEDAAAVLGTQAAVADGQAMLEALERYEAIGASWCVARASARLRELDGKRTRRQRHAAYQASRAKHDDLSAAFPRARLLPGAIRRLVPRVSPRGPRDQPRGRLSATRAVVGIPASSRNLALTSCEGATVSPVCAWWCCRTIGAVGVSVYVDHAFALGDWGRWSGGGHLQADTLGELHEFADRIGLRREWLQSKPGRPERDHYDLTRAGRELAVKLGAICEDRRAGTRRRQAVRHARRTSTRVPAPD
jgi:hypothetical protein